MIHNTKNPFPLKEYTSAEYFCDRKAETERIISAFENGRNLTLFALRRIGKTGLIHHVINKYSGKKQVRFMYVDLMPTNNLNDFIKVLTEAIVGKFENKPAQFLKRFSEVFKNIRPKISYDSLTGEPSIELAIESEKEAVNSLGQVFNYLNEHSKKQKIVIALDEFQQITNYPEQNIEALLRSHIQQTKNISFIFSGSHKHMLLSIFGEHKRPFYMSTEMMNLEKIKENDYVGFIQKHFEKDKRELSVENTRFIYEWARGHTYFVQYLCNKLFSTDLKKISNDHIRTLMASILKENEALYYGYRNFLSAHQWKLLAALAKENGFNKPMSREFIKKHQLHASSSVQSSLKGLLEKELVYEDLGFYYVYDVFLSRWLERL